MFSNINTPFSVASDIFCIMAEKENYATQPLQPGMHYSPGPASNPNAPMYPPNNMNQMIAPPSYDQATQPHYQPR